MSDRVFTVPTTTAVIDRVPWSSALEFEGHVKSVAKDLLLREGEHPAAGCIVTSNRIMLMDLSGFMNDEQGKDLLSSFLKDACKREKAIGLAFVAECWSVIGSMKHPPDLSLRPSESPDRVECLMVQTQWKGERRATMIRMLRDEKGKLAKLVELDNESLNAQMAGGRLADLMEWDETENE